MWTKYKQSKSYLLNSHTWGCTVYVLDPSLQDGQKIPKWNLRSRVGQYVGYSPSHASTVALVRNIRTVRISPQFHVIFDDNFETVRTEEGIEPLVWEELLTTNSFRSNIEDNDDLTTLDKEWFYV